MLLVLKSMLKSQDLGPDIDLKYVEISRSMSGPSINSLESNTSALFMFKIIKNP